MKILIVEDDIMLGELLQERLLRLKHERVRVCLTGVEAFQVLNEEAFDCAFVDLRLPDMDGLQLLTAIKEHDHGLPVVMMSGFPTMDHTIEAMRKGASDFLTKPFTLQDVALTLQRIMKERQLLLQNLSLQLEIQARKELEEVNRKLESRVNEHSRLFQISKEIDEIHFERGSLSSNRPPCVLTRIGRKGKLFSGASGQKQPCGYGQLRMETR